MRGVSWPVRQSVSQSVWEGEGDREAPSPAVTAAAAGSVQDGSAPPHAARSRREQSRCWGVERGPKPAEGARS